MSTVIDFRWLRSDDKSYDVSAICGNCYEAVTVRLAFGQPKWNNTPGNGPECPRCGCETLIPGAIVGVES